MNCYSMVSGICLLALLSSCSGNSPRSSSPKGDPATRRALVPARPASPERPAPEGALPDAGKTEPAPEEEQTSFLELRDGSRFKTSIYELKPIGELHTSKKQPYYIFSGRSCRDCDANITIYIHSPSDGPMKSEAAQPRYFYPGKELDYEDHKPLRDSRLFFGNCAASHANAAIWFDHVLGEDQKWRSEVFVAEVKDDRLVTSWLQENRYQPKLREAERAVHNGQCHEVAGVDRSSEP